MNPTQGPTGQINANWGDPQKVQAFRNALIPEIGQKAADDYVNQYQTAYQTQQKNAAQSIIGNTQGALTPDQVQANPVGASQFIGNGGKIINTGPGAIANSIVTSQKQLEQAKGKSKYVDPQTYNNLKGQFVATGGNEGDFDAKFNQYTDPTKVINYNTPEGRANQEAYGKITRQLQAQLDQYHAIPGDQKTLLSKGVVADVPILGQLVAPQAASYENNRKALAGQLSSLVGGGEGSGLRVSNADMDRWAKLLPSTMNTASVNNQNLQSLDKQIKAAFNVPTGIQQHYLPSNGKAPLASFNQ